jgi:hypothetical protein
MKNILTLELLAGNIQQPFHDQASYFKETAQAFLSKGIYFSLQITMEGKKGGSP